MSIRFRKSIKILPGVRLNLSKSGLSVTLGGRLLSFNLGKRGTYANVDLPGSGLTYRTRLGGSKVKGVRDDVTLGLNEDGTLSLMDDGGDLLPEQDAAAYRKAHKKEIVTWLEESCGRVNNETLALIHFHRATPAPTTPKPPEADPQITLAKHIEAIPWPRETNVSFDFGNTGDTVWLDVDLPEIEDMPTAQATVNKSTLRLVFKERSATQRRKEYQTHIHAVAFRLAGELFAAMPALNSIVLSAYSQRTNLRTGQISDDYLLSVRTTREQWQQINFANLDAIDVVAAFDLFTVRRQMSKGGEFTPIEPFTP
ncbi:MAG: DUF4236 domain-containing protein [Chloroflexi bacterium]|nr:DUF4236 domain-containing protein [Chloroflexota bacterium]MBP8057211.1 DUF4236 domain-containing protein [Chloroflexota bacterium]